MIDKGMMLDELPCITSGVCIKTKCSHHTDRETICECIKKVINAMPEQPPIDFAKRELPVKNTWKLKDAYSLFCEDCNIEIKEFEVTEPSPHVKKYYDKITKVDYSAIPKGSIVEYIYNHQNRLGWVERVEGASLFVNCVKIDFKDIIRVVEWGNE